MKAGLLVAQLRDQPLRLAVTIIAIALGVALSSAVYLVNTGALEEFGTAARRLVGDADLIVRGPRAGFPEALYPQIARLPGVEVADPILELDAAIPGSRSTLHVLALDPFRAAGIQPALLGELAANLPGLLGHDGIFLSAAAADALQVRSGGRFDVIVGLETRSLRVLGILSAGSYPQRLGIMDIAAAQWTFDKLGLLDRIDLRLTAGTDASIFRAQLARLLPPGVSALAPPVERDRAVNVTRAYRVNLNMLALVSLLTGAFLVFSTQSLSVLRRRSSLALLRAIGMTRGGVEGMLLAEGIVLGVIGAVLGVAVGHVTASIVLAVLAGDLGSGSPAGGPLILRPQPAAWAAFVLIGTAVAALAAWIPAREAARRAPALALKAGDAESGLERIRTVPAGVALLAAGAALAWLPSVGGLPVFGYGAIAALLFGAVLLVPWAASRLLGQAPRTGRAPLDVAIAQLQGSAGQTTISLAAIIVSFSLMIAMAIMVYSFRVSFEVWLGKILPADVQLRVPLGSDTAYWSPRDQSVIAATPGVDRVEFRRSSAIVLDGNRAPVTLTARAVDVARAGDELPLIRTAPASPAAGGATPPLPPAWVSEAVVDLYGAQPGSRLDLPLGGRSWPFRVAGVFRDYGRSTGSIVIPQASYVAATGDRTATEGSIWLVRGADAAATLVALRARLPRADSMEMRTSGEIREISLRIFDRAFAVTYALEAIAVLIGLVGVSFAASSATLARRAEFGMLRHIGMLRRQVLSMLAGEGLVMSVVGVLYGLVLGGILSLVLVYVINRQSFSWSVDLVIPWLQIAGFSVALVTAAAATATLSGRAAMGSDAVRAVREDW